jgi:hypothetical protein
MDGSIDYLYFFGWVQHSLPGRVKRCLDFSPYFFGLTFWLWAQNFLACLSICWTLVLCFTASVLYKRQTIFCTRPSLGPRRFADSMDVWKYIQLWARRGTEDIADDGRNWSVLYSTQQVLASVQFLRENLGLME